MKKILIVGAGFTGAIIAREMAEAGYDVDVIDKRGHIAGNAYDYQHEMSDGNIRVHKYGPHLFHTNNEKVYDYLSQFTEWLPYKHKVKAQLRDGQLVTLPVNAETKRIVGEENVIDTFYRPYTRKMWGMELEELNPDIINRVPIRDDDNEYYFPDDKYQYMPKCGYTSLVHNILGHSNIRVLLNTEFKKSMEKKYSHVFNSMPIDEYYDFKYGELPYRSIQFMTNTVPSEQLEHIDVATVNYTDDRPTTRFTNWQRLPGHGENDKWSIITQEYPCDYKENNMERYYPVKDIDGDNRKTYEKYAKIKNAKTTFVGRCGKYVYIDMDMAINQALQISKRFINETTKAEKRSN